MTERSEYLVRVDDDVVLGGDFEDVGLFGRGEDGASRIVWVVQDEHFGRWCYKRLQLV